MASCHMSLVEMDLEVFEIDEPLLRELLEEDQDEGKDANMAAESAEESNINSDPDMMDREQKNCLEKYGWHEHDFEWLNMMEPTNYPVTNDVIMNWFSDDFAGMLDFGYANQESYSQFSDEPTYSCLWEHYDI